MYSAKKKTTYDIIAVGESLHDVFYMLDDASANCVISKEKCVLCLEYAAKIPVQEVVHTPAAGNSANAAVGASRLGLKAALVTWVGQDEHGDLIRRALQADRVNHQYVIIDKQHPTSEAAILNFQGERTQLVHFEIRDYLMPRLAATHCIYYSAMGAKHAEFDHVLLRELKRQPKAHFVFQPGTTHIRRGLKPIKPLIARSDLFILNKDEAHYLLPEDGERTMLNMLATFHGLGAKQVIITDGKNGADAFDGNEHWHMPIFGDHAKEKTGAGDSFAIGATVALLKGLDLPTALRWGTANSWSVIQKIGPQAGLLTSSGMQKMLQRHSRIQPKLIK